MGAETMKEKARALAGDIDALAIWQDADDTDGRVAAVESLVLAALLSADREATERAAKMLFEAAKGFTESPLSDAEERSTIAMLAHFVLDRMTPDWRDNPAICPPEFAAAIRGGQNAG